MHTETLQRARALDPDCYLRPDLFTAEVRCLLGASWQLVGATSQVQNTGDVIVREVAGAPVLVVRGAGGGLNAFYNICPHRAGPLATQDERGLRRLRCHYHGWSYDVDGQLRVAPEMHEAEDFDPTSICLTPIEVRTWHGFVFVRLSEHESVPGFEASYAGVEALAGARAFQDLAHHTQVVYEVNANWKVYVDNFLEGYHLPFVHPDLTQLVSYRDYATELDTWWSVQRSPVDECGPYAAGEGLYFFVYPSTMLNIMPGRIQTNRVIPTRIDQCRVEFDFYYAPGAEGRASDDLRFSDQVQEEDRAICEHVQRALGSGGYRPGRLSPTREAGVWHWQELLRDFYRSVGD